MLIKKLFLLILIIFSINLSIADVDEKFLVKKIIFKGFKHVNTEHILLKTPIKIGKILTKQDVSESIRILFDSKNFNKIKISYEENNLIIFVEECPIINNIFFSGNISLEKNNIKNILKSKNIKIGNPLYPSASQEIKISLKNIYDYIGKYNSEINVNSINLKNNKVDLNIIIKESDFVLIKEINFIGNNKFSKKNLINKIELCEYNSSLSFFQKCIYQKHKLIKTKNILKNFYFNQGYVDFKINFTKVNIIKEKKFVYIDFYLYEGVRYKISEIIFNGYEVTQDLEDLKKNIINKFYKENDILKIKNLIKKNISKHGYNEPKIFLKIKKSNSNNKIQLLFNVHKGQKLYVNHINFSGNEYTKEHVIRRNLKQLERSTLEISNIYKDISNLNKLNYIEVIDINIKNAPNMENYLDIFYKIKENNIGKINFGIGFGEQNKINFNFKISKKNIFGSGNFIEINGEKNYHHTHAEMFFFNPYIKLNGTHANGKIFFNNFNLNNSYKNNYNLYNYGLSSNIIMPEYKNNIIDFGLEYTHNKAIQMNSHSDIWNYFNDIKKYNSLLSKEKNKTSDFKSDDIFFIFNWNYNTIDKEYFSTSGLFNNINSKFTVPGSGNSYFKILINSKYFIPLSIDNKLIFMMKTNLGYLHKMHRKKIPFYEKFYTGGYDSVRGFYHNTISPKLISEKCEKYKKCIDLNDDYIIGGDILTTSNIELILPTPFIKNQYNNLIRTSLFLDLGNSWNKSSNDNFLIQNEINNVKYIKSDRIRISSGIFLQWISPFGLVSLSYAIPIKKIINDRIEPIQFNIGKIW
ncbi:yaeT [Wigglesworthia glossinidia endosymbiont of Glossina brevipalpis]|uniref:Outer membrane protein assembly factor BamA n=1 Tax=Wigglesworthia glossinidia brevipalpis TaxID=36870 RepID=Q8D2H0_WIGBR|nr:yaeT [Wigglesworthia glossinidia endosymbiont of Glossina brevipalpis]